MKTTQQTGDDLRCVLRGVALAVGLLANIPFVFFLADSAAKAWPQLPWGSPQGMPLFIVLAAALLGYLIAWRWQKIGGMIAVVCAIGILTLVYLGSGHVLLYAALMISVPLLVAGVLLLACHRRIGEGRLQGS